MAETVAAVAVGSVVGGAQPILNQLDSQSKQGGPSYTEEVEREGSFMDSFSDILFFFSLEYILVNGSTQPPACLFSAAQ